MATELTPDVATTDITTGSRWIHRKTKRRASIFQGTEVDRAPYYDHCIPLVVGYRYDEPAIRPKRRDGYVAKPFVSTRWMKPEAFLKTFVRARAKARR